MLKSLCNYTIFKPKSQESNFLFFNIICHFSFHNWQIIKVLAPILMNYVLYEQQFTLLQFTLSTLKEMRSFWPFKWIVKENNRCDVTIAVFTVYYLLVNLWITVSWLFIVNLYICIHCNDCMNWHPRSLACPWKT